MRLVPGHTNQPSDMALDNTGLLSSLAVMKCVLALYLPVLPVSLVRICTIGRWNHALYGFVICGLACDVSEASH